MDSDDDSSSCSNSTPMAMDEYQDLPVDFILRHDDGAENVKESSYDDRSNNDDGLKSLVESMSSLSPLKSEQESSISDILCSQNAAAFGSITSSTSICNDDMQPVPSSTQEVSLSAASPSLAIPHRGSLRRILNPSSFHASQNAVPAHSIGLPKQSQLKSSSWPMYAINVATEGSASQYSNRNAKQCYQIIFDRQQYEFCTRLFALLDTDSESFIGPYCICEFVCLHCPVVRRRDDAIFALQCSEEDREIKKGSFSSPTFDEIWDRTVHSDPHCIISADTSTSTIHRIGIEGWMVFCRLLALAHHQESQRRFASRHLQQMMRHKHGGNATMMSPNEVVVVVDNPPPGPPSLISVCSLVDVEQERITSHNDECIQGWPFCPLPLPELDLDHCLVSTYNNNRKSLRMQRQPRGRVSVEPFSSSHEGDFILRFHSNDSRMVVRRSYSDFEWLNAILKLHKRPGQGHLCGRILPPFPSKQGGFNQQHSRLSKETSQSSGASHQTEISEKAIAAAKSGMGMISSMAKSVWSEYVSGSTMSSSPSSSISKNKVGQRGKMPSSKWSHSSKPEDVPTEVAHRIERYLNYLLENNALSTSFPLNAMLQASQSGLESAKQTLRDHTKHKKRHRLNLVAKTSTDGHSAASIFSALLSKTSTSLLRLQDDDDDTPWLRAAAQVAMALQFHGMLETTGHESTSAKIQHASLPKFCNRRAGSWDDEEPDKDRGAGNSKISRHLGSSESDSPKNQANFEAGVINIESELANEQDLGGYDMLPSPGPSEEHRVLNAGSNIPIKVGASKSQSTRSRFVYEITSEQSDEIHDNAVLGSISVDSDIDKLRDIIRSINHTLGNLYQSSAIIRSAQDGRNTILNGLLRDIDSWGDSGGIIIQRALVNGVATLESLNSTIEESSKTLTDDLMWQSSLAISAVGAVTEVRDAVRASHTASRAKRAAFMAAEKAKKVYESCDDVTSKEKIQHTQTEASNAQSHAIHATVVEYEANIAKKRSAVSLAQDVKSWNIHRRRELLRTCVQFAKSQQEACREAADTWESLREGLINSSGCSFANDEVNLWTDLSQVRLAPSTVSSCANTQDTMASGMPINLNGSVDGVFAQDNFTDKNLENSSSLHEWENEQQDFSEVVAETSNSMSSASEGFTNVCSLKESQQSEMEGSSDHVYRLAPPNISHLDEDYFSLHQDIVEGADSDSDENEHHSTSSIRESFHSGHDTESEDIPNSDAMSASMQSLIDGLMAWGEEGNDEKAYQTDIIGTTNDIQHNNLLE
eukprot:CAMPEP_0172318890 /NCGR_PEP_ID=MMETSP1058-20130122/36119_1 /TAXON_ID=83371 /ORGANISM="Detonula confervacea, Strain CCMP 353" /LENGTH=1268 /DNA_ID=CAMNT_0013033813 /DNA_START=87 /DNA_END=3893 /DNA_ORIENTATION=-